MKKTIKYIISYTAILLFLVSSTGISFVIHHCDTTKKDHVLFFTDHYKCETETKAATEKPEASCCCTKHALSCENKTNNQFTKSACCNNTYKYIKFSFQFDKVISIVKVIISETPYFINLSPLTIHGADIQDKHSFYYPPPLPFVGKLLIHFTHNIKIPFTA
ncbi:MAG: hypothetical protein HXX18_02895 [Bacteroidetes bacterium]|nr:hypothetical protein [Bacteroidota bacterium]